MSDFEAIVDLLHITNVGRTPVQLGISPPDEEEFLGTDITPFDGSNLFDGDGLVKIMPGRSFLIEEYRVNLGQLQNYIDKGLVYVLKQRRNFDNITVID